MFIRRPRLPSLRAATGRNPEADGHRPTSWKRSREKTFVCTIQSSSHNHVQAESDEALHEFIHELEVGFQNTPLVNDKTKALEVT